MDIRGGSTRPLYLSQLTRRILHSAWRPCIIKLNIMKKAFLSILIIFIITSSALAQGSCDNVCCDTLSRSRSIPACCEQGHPIPGTPAPVSGTNATPTDDASGDLCSSCFDLDASLPAARWCSVLLTEDHGDTDILLVYPDHSYPILRPPQA
jgi:hypothetical protein